MMAAMAVSSGMVTGGSMLGPARVRCESFLPAGLRVESSVAFSRWGVACRAQIEKRSADEKHREFVALQGSQDQNVEVEEEIEQEGEDCSDDDAVFNEVSKILARRVVDGETEGLIDHPESWEPPGLPLKAAGITISEIDRDIPEAASPSFGSRQGSEVQILREEDTSAGSVKDDGDIDYDDLKYQKKPDWMHDEVWQSLNNQVEDDEDDGGQPLWVDEEDPTWPEEAEDGWGFRTSQFFDKVGIKNTKSDEDDDEEDEELKENWENEADDWMINEITILEWENTVFANPSPLVVYAFARYGRRGMESWKTLEQLEKAVTSVWESAKAPLRAVKVDIGMEIDLGSALSISKDDCPQLLFIKNGKCLYRLEDQRTSEELVQVMAHFFYNGAKPSFMGTTPSPENFRSVV